MELLGQENNVQQGFQVKVIEQTKVVSKGKILELEKVQHGFHMDFNITR
jgi:hypothetical protein